MAAATNHDEGPSVISKLLEKRAIGLGLRTVHYAHILEQRPEIGFFEILSENFLRTAGRPMHILDQISERYPIVMHGVSLSIGSTDPLDLAYLRELRALKERTQAAIVSDHLCWTGVAGKNTHDLLADAADGRSPGSRDRPGARRAGPARRTARAGESLLLRAVRRLADDGMGVSRASGRAHRAAGILLDVNNVFGQLEEPRVRPARLPARLADGAGGAVPRGRAQRLRDAPARYAHRGRFRIPSGSCSARRSSSARTLRCSSSGTRTSPPSRRVHADALRAREVLS